MVNVDVVCIQTLRRWAGDEDEGTTASNDGLNLGLDVSSTGPLEQDF